MLTNRRTAVKAVFFAAFPARDGYVQNRRDAQRVGRADAAKRRGFLSRGEKLCRKTGVAIIRLFGVYAYLEKMYDVAVVGSVCRALQLTHDERGRFSFAASWQRKPGERYADASTGRA